MTDAELEKLAAELSGGVIRTDILEALRTVRDAQREADARKCEALGKAYARRLDRKGLPWEHIFYDGCRAEAKRSAMESAAEIHPQRRAGGGRVMERCKTCKHWNVVVNHQHLRVCEISRTATFDSPGQVFAVAYDRNGDSHDGLLYTAADFGCVMHEPEELLA